jgi:hypothetical protein
MSQIGDFMVVVSPGDSFLLQLVFWFEFSISAWTLAYPGRESQAGSRRQLSRIPYRKI